MVNEMRTVHDEFYLSYGLPWLSTFARYCRYNANRELSAPTQENVSPAEKNVPPAQDSMPVFQLQKGTLGSLLKTNKRIMKLLTFAHLVMLRIMPMPFGLVVTDVTSGSMANV